MDSSKKTEVNETHLLFRQTAIAAGLTVALVVSLAVLANVVI